MNVVSSTPHRQPRRASIAALAGVAWDRAPRLVVMVGLVVVTTALFGRVVTHDFINYDDPAYVTANRRVQAGLTLDNIRWAWVALDVANWHPLTWLSLELDASLWGLDSRGFHATNLALHVANTVLLFLALSSMTGSLLRAACVAMLFAIHPLHVESVAWVAERKDVLSTSFWMLTMLAYARYAERPSAARYLAVAVLFALGLAAKSMVVTLPCVLLLLDYWPLKRMLPSHDASTPDERACEQQPGMNPRGCRPRFQPASIRWLVLEKTPLFVLSAACGIATILAQGNGGAVSSAGHMPLSFRLMNACDAYLAYLSKAAMPLNLTVFYPHPMHKQVPVLAMVAAGMLLAATGWVCSRWRRQPYLAVGWFWFLGTLLPVIGLLQVGAQAIADRYTYVPLIGIFLSAVWGLHELVGRRKLSPRLAGALGIAAFVSFAACTWSQLGYWRDDVTLWRHALEVTGPNGQAYDGLGEALLKRGFSAEAVPYLRECALRDAEDDGPHVNLGAALLSLGRVEEARERLETAVRINPRNAMAHYNLGLVCKAVGDLAEATAHWQQALRLDPAHWKAHLALASVLLQQGAQEQAADHITAAERIDEALARQFMREHASSFLSRGKGDKTTALHERPPGDG